MLRLLLLVAILRVSDAKAVEMAGFAGYTGSVYPTKPAEYVRSTGGVGYGFLARVDFGPGQIESGFLYTPTSMTYTVGASEVKANGSYWILPLHYRIPIYSPFLSLSLGPDFALKGGTSYTIEGASVSPSASGYKSHFGVQSGLQASQDLGENLSAILDLRYRHGLNSAISVINSQSTRLNFFMISLGIQKRLD
ncbi:MAG: hypothetical protein KGP28_08565 [Bdellovibrionales bacterium]|nr:hypothetical protein [Bdellovibrionales bacterium]